MKSTDNPISRAYNRTISLRGKFIILLLTVSLTAVIPIAVISGYLSYQTHRNDVGKTLYLLADGQSIALGDYLAREVSTLQTVALDDTLMNAALAANAGYPSGLENINNLNLQLASDWQSYDENSPLIYDRLNNSAALRLKEYQNLFPENVEILLTDKYGALIGITKYNKNYLYTDKNWWQTAYNSDLGRVYISGILEPIQSEDVKVISLAIPLRSGSTNEVIGILRAGLNLQAIMAVLPNPSGETPETDLYFAFGSGLAVQHDQLVNVDENLDMLLSAKGKSFIETNYEGVPSLVSQSPVRTRDQSSNIDQLGWTIVAHLNRNEALAPVLHQFYAILIYILFIIAIVTGIALISSKFFSDPIKRLTSIANQVALGNLDVNVEVESKDEVGILATTLNKVIVQLRELITTYEQRVSERTKALETSAQISRRLSTILDQDLLIKEVVDQVQTAFKYDHTHIYLFDQSHKSLELTGGSGFIGQQLLEAGYQIPRGKGLIGSAAETNISILAPDVTQEPKWLPNPLLPETRSEISVPISIGENVLGVLDIQNNQAGSLSQVDVDVIQSIANQVAIAIQNTQSFAATQDRMLQETLISDISQSIQSTTTVDDALKIAVRELGRATGAKQTIAHIKIPDQVEDNTENVADE